ncbi:glycoside hydrolase [Teratosphaeria nubilosa]|uniref:glucan endo-1,3-beta-D-glucosidase n=1 Tax=Teratosphaeria nubilosa TaxID=161662 RepID=A0A6G1KUM2_9PEZI|nr:glycoside hydrolase [Teratosphaeria nubilosa]
MDSTNSPSPGTARVSPPQSMHRPDPARGHGPAPSPSVSPVRRTMQLYERTSSPLKRTYDRPESRAYGQSPSRQRSPSRSMHRDCSSLDRQRQIYPAASPGTHNSGTSAAAPGLTGLPAGMHDYQPFDSGSQALRDIDNLFGGGHMAMSSSPEPEEQEHYRQSMESLSSYRAIPNLPPSYASILDPQALPRRALGHRASDSQSSIAPLDPMRAQREDGRAPSPGRNRPIIPMPYNSHVSDRYEESVNHDAFVDVEDDVPRHREPRRKRDRKAAAPLAVGSGAAAMSRSLGSRYTSGSYHSVTGGSPGRIGGDSEKSDWLQKNGDGNKRMKWIIGSIVAVVLLATIIGGAVGGVLARKTSSAGSKASSAGSSSSKDGLYDINSPQVKELLNNNALHKVFPGIDYTPLNAQYPACLTVPPDQNNITLDMTMLAQLTPAVRLYGTDCNQTEMVLEAIDRLGYNDTLKVWLGVWLENNATTNARQLSQMYDILDNYPSTHFAGIIVGNEVLFRKDLSETDLGEQLTYVRNNLTAKHIDLPVATSDLGDDWNTGLASDTDIVMANVHPFFAGVTPDAASGWTWEFWQTNDVVLTGTNKSTAGYPKNIIAETGWPSSGGNDCGTDSTCPNRTAGAVASVDNMNTYLNGWVCDSLTNGTTYFWFEAFDEPWKVIYDTDTDRWEGKWGLVDANRNVKAGLKIPDCGGQTVDKPY